MAGCEEIVVRPLDAEPDGFALRVAVGLDRPLLGLFRADVLQDAAEVEEHLREAHARVEEVRDL
jgi:hypothetical protein